MEFRNEEEILREMITDAENRGLIKTNENLIENVINKKYIQNQYLLDLATHANILYTQEKKIKEIYENMNINTISDAALDSIGELFNIERIPGAPATIEITITNPVLSNEQITIPVETKLIIDSIITGGEPYYLTEEVIIPAGVESVTTTAESERYIFHNPVPVGARMELENFNNLLVTNEHESTTGRNIEEDDELRQRIKNASKINTRGTRDCIENYLNNNNLVVKYNLIPLYDGPGTIKIVIDTIETELENISHELQEQCMYITDPAPLCVQPDLKIIENLNINISILNNISMTPDEVKQLITAQIKAYINGGLKRDGTYNKGLNIGAPLYISQLIQYLLNEVSEVYSITTDAQETTPAEPNELIKILDITVEVV